jgi:peptidoglycan L-alanyl-D-glutamate endopeptidase CwlK
VTFSLSNRSRAQLVGVHPDLRRVVERALELTAVDFAIVEGLRSLARQKTLVAKGASKTLASKHLLQVDGWGHAVDAMAVGDLDGDGDVDAQDKGRTWDPAVYAQIAEAFDAAAAELGVAIRWGGRFKSFFDGPHFELAGSTRA